MRGVGEGQHRQTLGAGIDAQHGEIGARIGENEFSVELAAIRQHDLQTLRAFDDVIVGDDDAVRAHDDAGAQRTLYALARHPAEAAEEWIERALPHDAVGIDVHNCRRRRARRPARSDNCTRPRSSGTALPAAAGLHPLQHRRAIVRLQRCAAIGLSGLMASAPPTKPARMAMKGEALNNSARVSLHETAPQNSAWLAARGGKKRGDGGSARL